MCDVEKMREILNQAQADHLSELSQGDLIEMLMEDHRSTVSSLGLEELQQALLEDFYGLFVEVFHYVEPGEEDLPSGGDRYYFKGEHDEVIDLPMESYPIKEGEVLEHPKATGSEPYPLLFVVRVKEAK
jgi:hypothetical protein